MGVMAAANLITAARDKPAFTDERRRTGTACCIKRERYQGLNRRLYARNFGDIMFEQIFNPVL